MGSTSTPQQAVQVLPDGSLPHPSNPVTITALDPSEITQKTTQKITQNIRKNAEKCVSRITPYY